jgi:multidrug efflux pump subunit AcrA (membrane-fusion protein)
MRLAPEVNERTRTGLAFVIVENLKQSRPLVPGTFVQARIFGERLEQAIVIPRDAISVDKQGRQFVWVVGGTPKVIESGVEGEPAAETRRIERRILVDGQQRKMTTLQTMALVDAGVLEDDELIVLTNLDVLSDGSVIRLPQSKDIRTLDTELAVQPVQVLRLIESPSGGSAATGTID